MFTKKDFDQSCMQIAISEAERFIGATSPNPSVGAVLVQENFKPEQRIIGIGAHAKAGTAHAEIIAIENALRNFGSEPIRGSTLYVTLEPCNHHGKTPPCTEAIHKFGIKRVIYGVKDNNPDIKGGGISFLKSHGVEVEKIVDENCIIECKKLIAPFEKLKLKKIPWIVHKLAYRLGRDGILTMIPEKGASTFTSEESLREAHRERRKSDAIMTGIGTVMSDFPQFNVRFIPDHPNRRRVLVVMSMEGILPPQEWLEQEWELGFEVLVVKNIDEVLTQLGELGVQRLLVEAGPSLSHTLIEKELWDERLEFYQHLSIHPEIPEVYPLDKIIRTFKNKI